MGQVPPKYMLPSAPYGSSDAANSVNAVQPQAVNPQTPLLPPNFQDSGQMQQQNPTPQAGQNPFSQRSPAMGNLQNFYRRMYGQ
ncbi:MAG: hypothetical protein JO356_01050 [Acidobacteria bacterium]|nr:hypothetical protein [Acidobacteriota bacterium]